METIAKQIIGLQTPIRASISGAQEKYNLGKLVSAYFGNDPKKIFMNISGLATLPHIFTGTFWQLRMTDPDGIARLARQFLCNPQEVKLPELHADSKSASTK